MNLPSTLATRLVDYEPDKLVDYSDESDTADQDQLEKNVIYIGPLPARVVHEQIYEIFSSFGSVVDVKMVERGRKGKMFAFVEFAFEEEAELAVRAMDGGVIDYQEVIVSHVEVDIGTRQDYNANWNVEDKSKKALKKNNQ